MKALSRGPSDIPAPQNAPSAGPLAATRTEGNSESENSEGETRLPCFGGALQPGAGTLTVVTDNAWYAEVLLEQLSAHGRWEAVPGAQPDASLGRVKRTSASGLGLCVAAPGEWCRHAAAGSSSYFDRLWKRGVSKHSAREERYVLHVRRRAA